MTEKVAGHTFDLLGTCIECGSKWRDIWHVDETFIGKEGYAHVGALNMNEVNQIRAKKEAEEAACRTATEMTGRGEL